MFVQTKSKNVLQLKIVVGRISKIVLVWIMIIFMIFAQLIAWLFVNKQIQISQWTIWILC